MTFLHYKKLAGAAVVFLGMLSFGAHAQAAVLSFSIAPGYTARVGSELAVDVLVDPEGASINAVSADVVVPKTFTYNGSNDAGSLLNMWVDRPALSSDGQRVHFSGVTTSGFSGYIDPFKPEHKAPGKLIRLFFTPTTTAPVTLSAVSQEAYLDDGAGTPVSFSIRSLSFLVAPALSSDTKKHTDTEPPLPFVPLLVSDPLLFDGKYTLIFSTRDLDSGIDHYEVKEGLLKWVRAESPYLLSQQHLSKIITVKAVDRAGNEIIETVPESLMPHVKNYFLYFGVLLVVMFGVCAIIVMKWKKHFLSQEKK